MMSNVGIALQEYILAFACSLDPSERSSRFGDDDEDAMGDGVGRLDGLRNGLAGHGYITYGHFGSITHQCCVLLSYPLYSLAQANFFYSIANSCKITISYNY